jgi:spermidine/putrescine transport system substrate-binding protein
LFDPSQTARPLLADRFGVREMMGIALVYQGKDFNSTDPAELKAAADLLVTTKATKNCMGFKPGVGGKNDVVAGTAVAAIVYNGDAIQSVTEDPETAGFRRFPKRAAKSG